MSGLFAVASPRFVTALLAVLLVAGCQRTEAPVQQPQAAPAAGSHVPPAADTAPSESWQAFIDDYVEAYLAAHPAQAVTAGRHEFDGLLPDWSRAGIAAEIARLHAARQAALGFGSAELGPRGEYQRDYLLATIDRALFWMETADWPFVNPAYYFDWMSDSLDPSAYVSLDYAPPDVRMEAFTRYAENLPRAAVQIRDNLRMPMTRTRLEYGIAAFGGLADYLRHDVPAAFAGVGSAELQQRFAVASEAAAAALAGLSDWLMAHRGTATEDYALGAELFRQMLYDTERVDIALAELERIGRDDLRRNQLRLGEACAEFAPGESIRACVGRMNRNKPPEGPVAAARRQLGELRAFVVEQDLVSVPGSEEALVAESPPFARANFAYINIPGPYAVNQPSVYYIAPPDPSWPPEMQQDYIPGEADLLFTSVHEVWPGHFLNFLHANRAPWVFGRLFVTYAFGEGWAHYTEEMMLDAGLRGASAETRIGQLSNAMLRNARFLSAIGLHTQGMSVADAERLFMEEAYQDEGTARQQAARGTYDPAYLNYTLGKLLIRQLREDWTASRGGRRAWKAFHDEFLSWGGPPIPLVRAQMMAGHGD